jgi:cell division protein FtsB
MASEPRFFLLYSVALLLLVYFGFSFGFGTSLAAFAESHPS